MTTASDQPPVARVRALRLRVDRPGRPSGLPDEQPRTVTEGGDRVGHLPPLRLAHGDPGCRAAHRLNPTARMWSRREWERYQRTGRLPAWDYTSRTDRRRTRRGR
jgi:hypothetical protein